jgi:hypothetical protein
LIVKIKRDSDQEKRDRKVYENDMLCVLRMQNGM